MINWGFEETRRSGLYRVARDRRKSRIMKGGIRPRFNWARNKTAGSTDDPTSRSGGHDRLGTWSASGSFLRYNAPSTLSGTSRPGYMAPNASYIISREFASPAPQDRARYAPGTRILTPRSVTRRRYLNGALFCSESSSSFLIGVIKLRSARGDLRRLPNRRATKIKLRRG